MQRNQIPGKADGKVVRWKKKEWNSFSGGLFLPENDSWIFRPPPPHPQESKKSSAFPNLYPDPTYKIFPEPLQRKKGKENQILIPLAVKADDDNF